jgi:hypothetical protein
VWRYLGEQSRAVLLGSKASSGTLGFAE